MLTAAFLVLTGFSLLPGATNPTGPSPVFDPPAARHAPASTHAPDQVPPVRLMVRDFSRDGWSEWRELAPQAVTGAFADSTGLVCEEELHLAAHGYLRAYRIRSTDTSAFRLLTFSVLVSGPLEPDAVWYDDINSSRVMNSDTGTYANVVQAMAIPSPDGALNTSAFGGKGNGGYGGAVGTGSMSPYPFACITTGGRGIAMGIDPELPVVHRFLANRRHGLAVEFDIALSPAQLKSPNACSLSVATYDIDPQWGFRSAAERFYALFPRAYERRLRQEGIWMPFTPVNEVEAWEDFGFAVHETHRGTHTVFGGVSLPVETVDRRIGVLSFQYTEPWDIQIPVDPAGLTYGHARAVAEAHPDYGQQIHASAAFDDDGQWIVRLISAPWFSPPWALSYTTCAAPDASSASRFASVRAGEIDPALAAGFDGIYFDSLEFFWHYDVNYRPDHIRSAAYPLTFSTTESQPRPCVWNYSSQFDHIRSVCADLRSRGTFAMGNGFSWIPFSVSQLDILGTEFSWFTPADEKLRISAFRRTACAQKPIMLLLNQGLYSDEFIRPPHAGYTRYFEESLFFGFYPSFFSADASNDPYWKNPAAYNTGREFFRRYVPIIRMLNSQGWQPVTHAKTSNHLVRMERFDAPGDSLAYFTVRNLSGEPQRDLLIEFDDAISPDATSMTVEDILHGTPLQRIATRVIRMDAGPDTTYVLRCVSRNMK